MLSAVAEGSESTNDIVHPSQDAVPPPDDSDWEHIDTAFERGCMWEFEERRGMWKSLPDTVSARLEDALKKGEDSIEEAIETERGLSKRVMHIAARKQLRCWWCQEVQEWCMVNVRTIRRAKDY